MAGATAGGNERRARGAARGGLQRPGDAAAGGIRSRGGVPQFGGAAVQRGADLRRPAGAVDVDPHYAQLLSAAGDAYALYDGYTTTLQRLRGASEVYYQRALFSVQMPDGRDETFVTYVVEQ